MARRTKATPTRRDPKRPASTAPRHASARPRPGAVHPATQSELDRLDRLADLLDTRYGIPGTGIRFGLDGLLGLIPGIGDVAALGPSAYLVWRGYKLGADRGTLARMAANSGIDFVVGGVPLLGDVFDVAFKANRRNIDLLKRDLMARAAAPTPRRTEG